MEIVFVSFFWHCLTVDDLQIENKDVHVLLALELFWVFHVLWTQSICILEMFHNFFNYLSAIDHTIFNIYICSKVIEQTFLHSKLVGMIACTVDILILCSCYHKFSSCGSCDIRRRVNCCHNSDLTTFLCNTVLLNSITPSWVGNKWGSYHPQGILLRCYVPLSVQHQLIWSQRYYSVLASIHHILVYNFS